MAAISGIGALHRPTEIVLMRPLGVRSHFASAHVPQHLATDLLRVLLTISRRLWVLLKILFCVRQ